MKKFGANFGANFGQKFGNFVSNFATFFGNFVQQKGGAKGIAQLSRDTWQNGVSRKCVCVELSSKGGIAQFWGSAKLP